MLAAAAGTPDGLDIVRPEKKCRLGEDWGWGEGPRVRLPMATAPLYLQLLRDPDLVCPYLVR